MTYYDTADFSLPAIKRLTAISLEESLCNPLTILDRWLVYTATSTLSDDLTKRVAGKLRGDGR